MNWIGVADHRTDEPRSRSTAGRALGVVIAAGSILFWIAAFYGASEPLPRAQFAVLFVGSLLVLYALEEARRSLAVGRRIDAAALLASAFAAGVASGYFYRHTLELLAHPEPPALASVFAVTVVVALGYLAAREFGPLLPVVLVAAALVAFLGPSLPGALHHDGVDAASAVRLLATPGSGVYGNWGQNVGLWLAPLVLYTTLVVAYDGFRTVRFAAARLADVLGSGYVGTVAIASALIGSINGSYLANATLSGGETLPALRERGLRAEVAAGIEAAASSVGQVLPPAVLVVALLGGFLGVDLSLRDALLASLVPAAIVVGCLVVGLRLTRPDGSTAPADLDSSPAGGGRNRSADEAVTRVDAMADGIRFGVPILAFAALYAIRGRSWTIIAFWAVAATIVLGIAIPVLRASFGASAEPSRATDGSRRDSADDELVSALRETAAGLRLGVLALAPVVIVVAVIDGALDLLLATAVLPELGELLAGTAGTLAIVAVAVAVAFVVTTGLPTLVAFGAVGFFVTYPVFAEHGHAESTAFFALLYAAVAVGVTPHAASAATRTARIAEVSRWRVSAVAIRLVSVLFVLPFAILAHPELVSPTPGLDTARAGVLTLLGGLAVTYALNAPCRGRRRRRWSVRGGLFVAGALGMAHPSLAVQLIAIAAFVPLAIWAART